MTTYVRILALYEAARAVRLVRYEFYGDPEGDELLKIAADLDAQADALTKAQHADEVARAKGEG